MVLRVTDLTPTDTADTPYYYTFKVQCTSCRETHANWVGVSRHVGFIILFSYVKLGIALETTT